MYFSVVKTLRIAGKVYIPCICYKCTESLKKTIEMLCKDGKAVIYKDRVFFQNGVVIKQPKETAKKLSPSVKPVDSKKTAKAKSEF